MGWQIVYDGETYRQDELTLADAAELDRATGETWALLNVQGTPLRLAKVTAWLHSRRTGTGYDEVFAKTSAMPAVKFVVDHFEAEAPDDLPDQWENGFPPTAASQETDGSSGA